MLKEETSYDDRLPIYIRIAHLEEYPLHYHTDIEFIFVLKGEIRLLSGSNSYLMKEGDIFVCNGKEVHGMYATESENTVALIQINNQIFSKYYPNLSRSCYRTCMENPRDKALNFLRTELVKLLFTHVARPHRYQENNMATTKKLLAYLEANFNYFSIRNNTVLHVPIDNFSMSKRISRIILSVYENYYKKLTLAELSEKEHLSEYYMSHIVRDHIGISFRNFLAFARVESSQLVVLDEDVELSEICAITGFSGQHYFEKHFEKWFGDTPCNYRKEYAPKVKSEENQEKLTELERNGILELLASYGDTEAQENQAISGASHNLLTVTADGISGRSLPFNPEIRIQIKNESRSDANILNKLNSLNPDKISPPAKEPQKGYYGLDTIAGAVYLLRNLKDNKITLPFIDSPSNSEILQGTDCVLFGNGIAKCSYYALLFLEKAKGELIDSGINYWIVKKASASGMPSFVIIVFNGSDETDFVCSNACGKEKTTEAISRFNDEINMRFSIQGLFGPFKIATIYLDSTTDYSYYLQHYGNCSASGEIEQLLAEQYTLPYVNIYNADAKGSLELNTRLDGLCVQFITITPLKL